MTAEFPERRRFPRAAVEGRPEFRLGRRVRVRVVDISASGALLEIDEPLPLAARGRLQVLLAGSAFEGQIEIRREQLGADGKSRLTGATVTPLQPRHQEALEQFLSRAGS